MNIKDTLNLLIECFDRTRGIGHTKTMLDGARNVRCVVVAADEKHARLLQDQIIPDTDGHRRQHFAGLSGQRSFAESICRFNLPVAFDNFTLRTLFAEATLFISRLQDDNNVRDMKIRNLDTTVALRTRQLAELNAEHTRLLESSKMLDARLKTALEELADVRERADFVTIERDEVRKQCTTLENSCLVSTACRVQAEHTVEAREMNYRHAFAALESEKIGHSQTREKLRQAHDHCMSLAQELATLKRKYSPLPIFPTMIATAGSAGENLPPAIKTTLDEYYGATAPRASVLHELKVWPEFYDPFATGKKTFAVCRNDRDFRVGDRVILWECDKHKAMPYTGRATDRVISYVLTNESLKGLPSPLLPGYVVLGLKDN